ncbi:MAG: uracil-DNA glycosylase [Caulobacteraceae bacterium]
MAQPSLPDMGPDPCALAALLAFWADSGVDACVQDEPFDRMAEGAARLAKAARPPPPEPAGLQIVIEEGPDYAALIADAWAAAAAAKDLAELEAAIAAYEGCTLKSQGAKSVVFSRGNPNAPVMIIGEGPGAEEDAQGQPFVGRAGKLLDKMIAAAGLTDQVFITNTVFWRPPGNRNPTTGEQAACQPFLERAISLVQPKVLLLSGGVSAKSLLKREEGILSLHGRWLDWTSRDGKLTIPALPTLHPAFLLRQPAAKKKAWADLLTLMSRLDP